MIAIIDYGLGNSGSIRNMLKKIGVESSITADEAVIRSADKLIIPGVGAFDEGMKQIESLKLKPLLDELVLEQKVPVLGICLGMQLFCKSSEEGVRPGLGWIDAECRRFRLDASQTHLRVPHMGWNTVRSSGDCGLFTGFSETPRFYFVHSYHVVCNRPEDSIGTTHHGYDFTCAVQSGNIVGTQFHPEKSHKFGLQLLQNFVGSKTPCWQPA
ncbi:MAG: imidazole glycerol phosphate synthase subunit HisH [Planctomycetaceae bacterium]|jgi:imidazole glycerol-phosphate synthase subunit HisH|nr:imidazole glycerol phosphate synthase subunit HisH [Planctomycetaceae bacterium]MBT6156047.1 imidazole glycerol phosphate synthase subunit HisH [Planctomycetaceae bacterium]MBT6487512.1 imidazole glycerol phosphate synthase subunit HisH [Planctomycetaceae bacterium]MBT6495861.1 imidazole glycerol phosphate synthase subunit HisH [Planctomycetaceae bacterium]